MKYIKLLFCILVIAAIVVASAGTGFAIYTGDKGVDKLPDLSAKEAYLRLEHGSIKRQPEYRPEYKEGEVLVKFKEGINPQEVINNTALAGLAAERVHSIKPPAKKFIKSYKLERDSKGWYWFLGKNYKEVEEIADEEAFQQAYQDMNSQEKSLYRSYKVTLPEDISVQKAVSVLRQNPAVEYAEPNYLMELQGFPNRPPNDPYYHSRGSWGQDYHDLWGIKKIKCNKAWKESLGKNVVVAVIDTGVDNHEDLAENIWINKDEIPDNGIDDDENGYIDDVSGYDFSDNDSDPSDYYGHGTHCAGTIAAVGNNNKGVIGVAPEAKIMPVKIFPNAYLDVCVNAIKYAADNGANVLSNSWGGFGTSQVLDDIFNYAHSKGCVNIAAAGNDNMDVAYFTPANINCVISVAATDHNDQKADFSNYGILIDVSAPGGDGDELPLLQELYSAVKASIEDLSQGNSEVRSYLWMAVKFILGDIYQEIGRNEIINKNKDHIYGVLVQCGLGVPMSVIIDFLSKVYDWGYEHQKANNILSTMPDNSDIAKSIPLLKVSDGYYRIRGTSMACPHVAGLAALVISQNPEYTNIEVENQIIGTTDNIDSLNPGYEGLLGGRINAHKALTQTPVLMPKIVYSNNIVNDDNYGDSRGNDNGAVEQGETIELSLTLKNYGRARATEVSVLLSTDDPHINIQKNSVNFGDIPSKLEKGSEVTSPEPVIFEVLNSKPLFEPIKFDLDITTSEGNFTETFRVCVNMKIEPVISGCFPYLKYGIHEDKIVWDDERSGDRDIYMYDLYAGQEIQITDYPNDQEFPSIYENKITWRERDEIRSHLHVYNLSTGQEILAIESHTGFSAIYNNRVVWEDYRNGNFDIYMYDLDPSSPTYQQEIRITTDPAAQAWPAIYGNRITWMDDRNSTGLFNWGNADIYMYDLSTNQEIQITNAPEGQSGAVIYDDKIVWQDGRNGDYYDIYMYDLDPYSPTYQQEIQITTDSRSQFGPTIYEDKIVWLDGNSHIYMYDIPTRQEFQITTDYSWWRYTPVIYGDKIAWFDVTDNTLYKATLFYPQPYKADIDIFHYHSAVCPGDVINIEAKVTNTGTSTWPAGTSLVRPKFYAYSPDGRIIDDLPCSGAVLPYDDVAPGETITISYEIPTGEGTPLAQLGEYRIALKMIHNEGEYFTNEGKLVAFTVNINEEYASEIYRTEYRIDDSLIKDKRAYPIE